VITSVLMAATEITGVAVWPQAGPPPLIAPFTLAKMPDGYQRTAMAFPLIGNARMENTFNRVFVNHRHTATDIVAPKMTPIVAPFSGRLGFKRQTFWIYGNNGYFCLGTHLNDDLPGTKDNSSHWDFMFAPNLRSGQEIRQGQLIGYVGDSGWATGPHLHFELFDRKHRLMNSYYSLKSAYRLQAPVVILSDYPKPPVGQIRIDGMVRGYDPQRAILTLIAVARQVPSGKASAFTSPTYYRFKNVPPGYYPRNRDISVYFRGIANRVGWAEEIKLND